MGLLCYAQGNTPTPLFFVKRRVERIEVPAVQMIGGDSQTFTEALVMNDFSLPQEANGINDIGIVAEAKDVVVGSAGLLFCCNHISTTSCPKNSSESEFFAA